MFSVTEMPKKKVTYGTTLGAHFSCWALVTFLPLVKDTNSNKLICQEQLVFTLKHNSAHDK